MEIARKNRTLDVATTGNAGEDSPHSDGYVMRIDAHEDVSKATHPVGIPRGAMSPLAASRVRWRPSRLLLPEFFFLLLSIPLCLFFCLVIPAGGGLDEPMHVARVYELAQGFLFSEPTTPDVESQKDVNYGNVVDEGLWNLAIENCLFFQRQGDKVYRFPIWEDEEIASDLQVGENVGMHSFANASINSPVAYLPYMAGLAVASLFTRSAYVTIIVMRLFGIATFIASMFAVLRIMPFGKWVMLAVATLPNSLSAISTVTCDLISLIACALLIACFLRLSVIEGPCEAIDLAPVALACVGVSLTKFTYLPLLGLMATPPLWNRSLRSWRAMGPIVMILTLSFSLFFLWYLCVHHINTGVMWNDSIDPDAQKAHILANPLSYLALSIRTILSYNVFSLGKVGAITVNRPLEPAPWLSMLVLCVSCVVHWDESPSSRGGLRNLRGHWWTFLITCTLAFALVSLLIATALYLQFNEPGSATIEGIQSRYFLQVLPLLLLPISLLTHNGIPTRGSAAAIGTGTVARNYLIVLLLASWVIVVTVIMVAVF